MTVASWQCKVNPLTLNPNPFLHCSWQLPSARANCNATLVSVQVYIGVRCNVTTGTSVFINMNGPSIISDFANVCNVCAPASVLRTYDFTIEDPGLLRYVSTESDVGVHRRCRAPSAYPCI